LKWDKHFLIGLAFVIPGTLLASASFGASPICGVVFGRNYACGSLMNYETLTSGAVLIYVGVVEFLVALKRKKEGEIFWESHLQKLMREVGMLAMLVGAIVGLVTYYRINSQSISMLLPWSVHNAYGTTFYSGLLVLAIGAALITGSRFIGVKPMKVPQGRVMAAAP
jgi:hypothetical protein